MLAGPCTGDGGVPGPVFFDATRFLRDGTRLVTHDRGAGFTAREARTGKPVPFRLRCGHTSADSFALVQWLDDDRVAVSCVLRRGLGVRRLR
jgi:hypothetical protein